MDNVKVIQYRMNFERLTLDLYETDKLLYERFKLLFTFKEYERGYLVKKEYKPTKTGTKIIFKPAEDKKEYKEFGDYLLKLSEKLK